MNSKTEIQGDFKGSFSEVKTTLNEAWDFPVEEGVVQEVQQEECAEAGKQVKALGTASELASQLCGGGSTIT